MPKVQTLVGDLIDPWIVEVAFRGTLALPAPIPAIPVVSVFHLKRVVNTNPFDPTNVAAVMGSWYDDFPATAQATQFQVDQTEARQLDDPTAATGVDPTNRIGQITGDLYASDAAVYIQLKSGLRGRSYFGSKHFAAPVEAQITGGYLNTATGQPIWAPIAAGILDLAVTGVTDADGNVWKLIILSKQLSNLESSPATFTYAIPVSCPLNTRIGTMGRRRGERGAV